MIKVSKRWLFVGIRKKSKLLNLLEQLNNEDDRPKRLLDIFANCNIRNRVVKFSLVPNDFKPAWLNPLKKKEKSVRCIKGICQFIILTGELGKIFVRKIRSVSNLSVNSEENYFRAGEAKF